MRGRAGHKSNGHAVVLCAHGGPRAGGGAHANACASTLDQACARWRRTAGVRAHGGAGQAGIRVVACAHIGAHARAWALHFVVKY